MNAKSFLLFIICLFISFAFGKQCSTDFAGIERQTSDYTRETNELGEETRAIREEINIVARAIECYETNEMDLGGDRLWTWDNSRGNDSPCFEIKGGNMREGIAKYLLPLVYNTPSVIEVIIISFILFLVVRLLKKSYPAFFEAELVPSKFTNIYLNSKAVKVKHLIPVAIAVLGLLYYAFVCKERFTLALADGVILSLLGIIFDNSWEAIKSAVKGLFGLIGKSANKENKQSN